MGSDQIVEAAIVGQLAGRVPFVHPEIKQSDAERVSRHAMQMPNPEHAAGQFFARVLRAQIADAQWVQRLARIFPEDVAPRGHRHAFSQRQGRFAGPAIAHCHGQHTGNVVATVEIPSRPRLEMVVQVAVWDQLNRVGRDQPISAACNVVHHLAQRG